MARPRFALCIVHRAVMSENMARVSTYLTGGHDAGHRPHSSLNSSRKQSNVICHVTSSNANKKAQLTQGLRATAHFSKVAVSRHLGYYQTANSAIRSTDPENPCLEPDMEWIGMHRLRDIRL